MIVIDYSMICKSNFAIMAKDCTATDKEQILRDEQFTFDNGFVLCYDTFRVAILKSLRKYNRLFSKDYGRMVIACDDRSLPYWRKEYNPHYKGNRKTYDSPIPWKLCTDWTDRLTREIKEHFPYTVVSIPGAEADDIIAVCAIHYGPNEKVMVGSRDHDFKQLKKFPNVYLYDPVKDEEIEYTAQQAKDYLFEHIILGDRGDGIPNIMSPENIFVDVDEYGKQKSRQKIIRKTKVATWYSDYGFESPEEFCDSPEMLERFNRNTQMIDLTLTPQIFVDHIKQTIDDGPLSLTNDNILPYLSSLQDPELIKNIDDFHGANVSTNPFTARRMKLNEEQ